MNLNGTGLLNIAHLINMGGTTQQWHSVAPTPWIIIGVFYPPHKRQLSLF